jgi:acetyl esterase
LRAIAGNGYASRVTMLTHLGERLQGAVAAGVVRLPSPLLRLLSGGGTIRIDGQELDAEVQLALAMLRLTGHRDLDTMTPAQARDDIRRNARIFAGTPIPMARIEALTLPGPADAIPAQLYVPRVDGPLPLVVYYHGGGWVVGGLDTHDSTCRFLAREADALVLAVDYRLAPEHRFPAAVEDALAAFQWAVREAGALGGDPARVAVAGDSAGGNLAAVVSQLARDAGGPCPAAQLLIYPATDLSTKRASVKLFSTGFFLTERDMDWYKSHYAPDRSLWLDPRTSPLLAESLRGLPPAIVATAGFDVLRDEGEEYARRLKDAGVRVELRRIAGQIHGFANATGVSPAARSAMQGIAGALRGLLAP